MGKGEKLFGIIHEKYYFCSMKRRHTQHIALLALIGLLVTFFGGCRRVPLSPRLTDINTLSETAPLAALDSLNAINPDTLSDRDRNYYDFLVVKCERRAFLPIESDSLILKVIDYASQHKQDGYYPEALYTGGLVYAALGDQPTALQYYHKAADEVPDDTLHLRLRSKINSQTGRLLAQLHINEEAQKTILRTIEIDMLRKDTLNWIYDCHLVAALYQREEMYEEADSVLNVAMNIGGNFEGHPMAVTRTYLAVSQAHNGDMSSARSSIRIALREIKPHLRNTALTHAARIYMEAGQPDTAYMYARELINSAFDENKVCGYQILLSPELRHLLSPDSINHYFDEYASLMNGYYDANSNALSLQQQASYNYYIHFRKRAEAETLSYKRGMWLALTGLLLFIAIFVAFYLRYRNKRNLLRLHEALNVIDRLSHEISEESNGGISEREKVTINVSTLNSIPPEKPQQKLSSTLSQEQELRGILQKKIRDLIKDGSIPYPDKRITDSSIYSIFAASEKTQNPITETSDHWEELNQVVLTVSPDFRRNLEILMSGKLRQHLYHTALLIKCGFSSSAIGRIVSRERNTIKNRLNTLSKRILDEDLDTTSLYIIISHL